MLKERAGGLTYALYASNDAAHAGGYISVGSTDTSVIAPTSLAVNQWSHVAVTFGGGTFKIYVNGTQAATLNKTGTMATSTNPLRIGGNTIWSEYFAGLIDEVRIYNRVLSAAEIQTDMNTPVVGN
jgi:hypothetical protein